MMAEGKIIDVAVKMKSHSIHLPKQSHQTKSQEFPEHFHSFTDIIFQFKTHHQYHSLAHLKTTAIEIQGIKIIKKNETRRKEHSV
jgi:hypothetical protein